MTFKNSTFTSEFKYMLLSCSFPFADLSVTINSCQSDIDVIAAGQNNSEYLHLAKKGGGHKGENLSTQDTVLSKSSLN